MIKFLEYLKYLWCKHHGTYQLRRVYGDEINEKNCRSLQTCKDCNSVVRKELLN